MSQAARRTREEVSEFCFQHGRPTMALERPAEGTELMSLGIDDTDSASLGMCTSYLAAVVAGTLLEDETVLGFWDYPNLVRLNPQVPDKTRGNGALALRFFAEPCRGEDIIQRVGDIVEENAIMEDASTHPGFALAEGSGCSLGTRSFYHKCLHRIVDKREALRLASSESISVRGYKKGLGIIGAVAALGADLTADQTFEIIAYRAPDDHSRTRDIEDSAVIRMDREAAGTFYNYDYLNKKCCVVPASPCPVYFGIRGESPVAVKRGYHLLDGKRSHLAVIFRTNQHTDAHIESPPDIASVVERSSVSVSGRVCAQPRDIIGGHVIFAIEDSSGRIDCAAYEPTKQFRDSARELMVGDIVRAYGSVRPGCETHGPTINLEKIEVIKLVAERETCPTCPSCGSRMESMGANAGYRCRRNDCRFKDRKARRVKVPIKRGLEPGFIEPPPVAWRHLYRPLARGIRFGTHSAAPCGSASSTDVSTGASGTAS